MRVLFIAGFGPVITDIDNARNLYVTTLGLPLEEDDDHYFHTGDVSGTKHFALWPLSQAAQSCFGTNKWPEKIPAPTSWLEFEVEDVEAATKELIEARYKLLVSEKKEPWGQIVTRFLSTERILTAITFTPAFRNEDPSPQQSV